MPWQAVYIHASHRLQQQTRTQMYLNTTWPQAILCRTIYAKGHLSFRANCPDSYSCLSVLYVLYLPACGAAGHLSCTMQFQAASNAYYAVLGSSQRELLSLSHRTHPICTISRLYISKLYSIAIYLGHKIYILDFYTLKL